MEQNTIRNHVMIIKSTHTHTQTNTFCGLVQVGQILLPHWLSLYSNFLQIDFSVFEFAQCTLRDVCSETQPCERGQCILNATEATFYTCQCPDGYEGSRCQREINECLTVPVDQACQNGGTCVDQFLSISCLCPQGFTGNKIM